MRIPRVGPRAIAVLILSFCLVALKDSAGLSAKAIYREADRLFHQGDLGESEQLAELGYQRFFRTDPAWATKLRLLQAEASVWRGTYQESLYILSVLSLNLEPSERIEQLTLEGVAYGHLQDFALADEKLERASDLCRPVPDRMCGAVLRARGVLAIERGKLQDAQELFLASLEFAKEHHDRWLEVTALANLGVTSLQYEHYDEALDWSSAAYRSAVALGEENQIQAALGNLGWAYFELGDLERSLELFLDAERRANQLGNLRLALKWITTAGYVYQDTGDWVRAADCYHRALDLARGIGSVEDVITSLEVLSHLSIETGHLDAASQYLTQVAPLIRANGNRLDQLEIKLAEGRIASGRRDPETAKGLLEAVEMDSASQPSMRLDAEHELARLYESTGDLNQSNRMYQHALDTFESARAQIRSDAAQLPFLSNAARIYDDYVQFLVSHGKTDEALEVADQSRARTLAEGLGVAPSTWARDLQPTKIAASTGSVLLFFWLGRNESYLWVITPKKVAWFRLPAEAVIEGLVEQYRSRLLKVNDLLEPSDSAAETLYRALLGSAQDLIPQGSRVVVLADGALSRINFEALVVPGTQPHYWIQDVTLTSAPALYMLASTKKHEGGGGRLLLLGDALSPTPDYPDLPMAGLEVKEIQRHFQSSDVSVYTRERANPEAYLSSAPQQFAYIHFVAHGVASRSDPLDSAIILSRGNSSQDSFKLHAREIIQHPVHARLVTISACYGSGTRTFAGEGLVGLSWAFLRAGAHNVIGALWEVSDESTPRLMGRLYQGLEKGLAPEEALREAKLSLLDEKGSFRKPFFWAPFQIYTGP
jgi:CHAT domain-containing protein